MDRIDNVDLYEALKEIARNNTFYHLDNDLNISVDQMKQAAKLDDPTEKTLIWISSPTGIDCYPEREVFQKDTRGYNGVMFYGFDMKSDRKLAYAVEVSGIKDDKVYGNLYQTDIHKFAEKVRQNPVTCNEVLLFIDDPDYKDRHMIMPREKFMKSCTHELPKISRWRYEPSDPYALRALLDGESKDRAANCKPGDLWLHVSNLYDDRLAFYSNQILRDLNKLPQPNSPDKQNFSSPLNSYLANNFDTEQKIRVLNALPFKNAAFIIQKGQRNMMITVPRDEILRGRQQGRQEKPSIINQIDEGKKALLQRNEPERTNKVNAKKKEEEI